MVVLKIGMDYHGVITEAPEFFAQFNQTALNKGHLIYILSGGIGEDLIKDLKTKNIPYTKLWSLYDYFLKQNNLRFLKNGRFKVDDLVWNRAKAHYCVHNKIDFYIDDSMLYGQYFTTLFCLYNHQNAKCFIDDKNPVFLDFNKPADFVLDDILNIINQYQNNKSFNSII